MARIDLNSDVAERPDPDGLAADLTILDAVTSANVACGFHAGDASTMQAICVAALARGVRIGAHIGYDDKPGFGRRPLDVPPGRLRAEATYQLGALAACAGAAGGQLAYVKPHGALYSRCAADLYAARAIAQAAADFDPALTMLGPPGSMLLAAAAAHGLAQAAEGFADRAYRADGTLAPRSEPGSVLEAAAALAQAEQIVNAHSVRATDGTRRALDVASLCVHSDTPGAPALAHALRERLAGAGIDVRPFA